MIGLKHSAYNNKLKERSGSQEASRQPPRHRSFDVYLHSLSGGKVLLVSSDSGLNTKAVRRSDAKDTGGGLNETHPAAGVDGTRTYSEVATEFAHNGFNSALLLDNHL